jgi:hypothetical protein
MGAIAELGARADTRTRGKSETLEDFLIEMDQMILSRMAQFYTEERQWRITGSDGNSISGTFSNREMTKTWEREPAGIDEMGNETPPKMEEYIPEMDIKVKVVDERPTSRNYYIEMAMNLLKAKAMDIESFWYTMEEGKFPPKEDILKRIQAGNGPFSIYSPQMQSILVDLMQQNPAAVAQIVKNQIPEAELMKMLQGGGQQIPTQVAPEMGGMPVDAGY